MLRNDDHRYLGKNASGAWVQGFPSGLTIDAKFMERGRERYDINCSPCHGAQADGNGVVRKLGLASVANLHDRRIVELADGEIFNVIANGKNTMGPYGANVPPPDRWAIIAYLRALQLSRLGTPDDVPDQQRAAFKQSP